VTTRFDQFDASFDPTPSQKEPAWLEGGLLPSEYLMVGVIDVRHRETTPRDVVAQQARKEARALGCDLVMPEPPHEPGEDGRVLAPEPGRSRFLCALPRPGAARASEPSAARDANETAHTSHTSR
jgi:hypothetical protein